MNMAREACISDPTLLWAIILGNLGIALAYFWIPLSVVRVLNSQDMLPQPMLWMLSALFILSCGLSHLVGVVVIFRPYYGLEGGIMIITAFISLTMAVVLHRAVPSIRLEAKEYAALKERVRTLVIDLDKERSCRDVAAQAVAEAVSQPSPAPVGPVTPDTSPDATVP